jgi:hypothetical protein
VSQIAAIVGEVRTICKKHSNDWRATRARIKERWQTHGGGMRDSNGYELNTACTIAALLHGNGDFSETLRLAFNFGWDCDNNAATAGAILGVLKGRRWMGDQGWNIVDTYRNTTRDNLPNEQPLTELENTLIECARIVVQEQGGELATVDGNRVYRIRCELPANVEALARSNARLKQLREFLLRNSKHNCPARRQLLPARHTWQFV